ncbi:MAG: stage II sporulation protein P [Clostridia bacterium]|nr:stage II sporulation protein P [Clostridia bacterium]
MRRTGKRLLSALLSLTVLSAALVLPVWAHQQSGEIGGTLLQSETLPDPPKALPVMGEELTEQQPLLLQAATVPPHGNGGIVSEEIVGGGSGIGQGVFIKNASGVSTDWSALLEGETVRFSDTDQPQVLIFHTHTTESYMTYYAGYYNNEDVGRPTDIHKNVCAVGEVLANRLRSAGIGVIHDTTLYDYPEYTGAYGRSRETVEEITEKYPSICLAIDLHRDAILRDSVTRVKPTVTVDGQKAAQVMLVLGAGESADNPNPTWRENVRLGFRLASVLAAIEPDLSRPVSLTESNYNQHLLPQGAMLLLEIGTDVNTFSEAMVSASLVGDALVSIMGR